MRIFLDAHAQLFHHADRGDIVISCLSDDAPQAQVLKRKIDQRLSGFSRDNDIRLVLINIKAIYTIWIYNNRVSLIKTMR